MVMQVVVMKEAGMEEALYGLSLSFKDRAIPPSEWWTDERYTKMKRVADSLAGRGGGHNKFLESIVVWIDIEAPRYWWSEFDTYRAGITKQSESTMHTLRKRDLMYSDFAGVTHPYIEDINVCRESMSIQEIKAALPESYLQRRLVCTNYKALRNIYHQRLTHKLPEWGIFCKRIKESLIKPEWVVK